MSQESALLCYIKALRVFDVVMVVGLVRPPPSCCFWAVGAPSGVEEAEPEVGLLGEVLEVEKVGDEVPPDQNVLAATPAAADASALAAAKQKHCVSRRLTIVHKH